MYNYRKTIFWDASRGYLSPTSKGESTTQLLEKTSRGDLMWRLLMVPKNTLEKPNKNQKDSERRRVRARKEH
jgi:hypothetical protein